MRVLSALALGALLACGGCGVPEVNLVGDDASDDGTAVTPDATSDAMLEAGDDGSLDAPESSVDAGGCPDSAPSGYICCGDFACGQQCNSASCSACTSKCEAGQICCVHGANLDCHVAGVGC
jgi:hypothetical protein